MRKPLILRKMQTLTLSVQLLTTEATTLHVEQTVLCFATAFVMRRPIQKYACMMVATAVSRWRTRHFVRTAHAIWLLKRKSYASCSWKLKLNLLRTQRELMKRLSGGQLRLWMSYRVQYVQSCAWIMIERRTLSTLGNMTKTLVSADADG